MSAFGGSAFAPPAATPAATPFSIDPVSLGLAAVNAGLKIFGGMSKQRQQHEAQKRQVRAANRAAIAQRNAANAEIRRQNSYAMYEYGVKKQMAEQQMQYNKEAATRGYITTQENRIMKLKQMAFARIDRDAELLEAVGANAAAMEGDNRSAALADAKATYGRFGRQQVQDRETVMDANRQSIRQMEEINLQHRTQDLQAYSQIAVMPYLQQELGAPALQRMPKGPSGLNTALMIGGGLMAGLGTYNQFAAPHQRIGGGPQEVKMVK